MRGGCYRNGNYGRTVEIEICDLSPLDSVPRLLCSGEPAPVMNKRRDEKRFELMSPLSVDQIHERLAVMTIPQRMDALIRAKERHLKDMYHGTLSSSGFTLQRLTLVATITLKLKGKYLPGESGTTIVVATNAGELVTSALAITVGLMLPMAAIFLAISFISDCNIWGVVIAAVIGACMFGYVHLLRMQIVAEVAEDKKKLAALLDALPA